MLRQCSHLGRALKRFFDFHGTTSTRFMAMIVIDLAAEQGGVLPGDVAGQLDVSQSVATEAINALVRRGLLATVSLDNTRSRKVALTTSGQKMLAEQLVEYFSLMANFMHRNSD